MVALATVLSVSQRRQRGRQGTEAEHGCSLKNTSSVTSVLSSEDGPNYNQINTEYLFQMRSIFLAMRDICLLCVVSIKTYQTHMAAKPKQLHLMTCVIRCVFEWSEQHEGLTVEGIQHVCSPRRSGMCCGGDAHSPVSLRSGGYFF